MKSNVIRVFLLCAASVYASNSSDPCECEKSVDGTYVVCNVTRKAAGAQEYCSQRCNGDLASIKSEAEFQELNRTIGEIRSCGKQTKRSSRARILLFSPSSLTTLESQFPCPFVTKTEFFRAELAGYGIFSKQKVGHDYNTAIDPLPYVAKVQDRSRIIGGKSERAFYIGARDDEKEGMWRWIDDNSLLNETYSRWKIVKRNNCLSQPDEQNICGDEQPANQDYAVLQMCNGSNFGTWFDVIGNISRPFICKLKVNSSEKSEPTTPPFETTPVRTTMASAIEATPAISSSDKVITTPQPLVITEADSSNTDTGEPTTPPFETTPVRTTMASAIEATPAISSSDKVITTPQPLVITEADSSNTDTLGEIPSQDYTSKPHHRLSKDYQSGTRGDDYLRQLRCMILRLQKKSATRDRMLTDENNRCGIPEVEDLRNPIIRFEEGVSQSAAELIFNINITKHVSVSVVGIRLDLIPFRPGSSVKNGSALVVQMRDLCPKCEKFEIDYRYFDARRAIVVGARFERSVLDGLGVYDAPKVKTMSSNDIDYVSGETSVLSVTVFKNDESKGTYSESTPTRTHFDIRKDDSLRSVRLNGKRSRLSDLERKCVFMTEGGHWSDHGCVTYVNDRSSLYCHCNHTTAFAVMVSLNAIEIPTWLDTVLLVVEFIGLIFLALTLTMLIYLKQNLKKGRILTQLHLCSALLMMHLAMICANYAVGIDELCVILTAVSHYFMIASSMWMLNEGYVLYQKTSSGALNFDIHKTKKTLIVSGWVAPLLYVSLCLGIGLGLDVYIDTSVQYDDLNNAEVADNNTDNVPKYAMCWLGTKHNMVLAAIIPIAISLLLATMLLIWVTKIIWNMNEQALEMMPAHVRRNHQSLKSTARAVGLLLPILGLPWALAFMVNIDGAEVVFIAIHGIANGLQGVVIFLIYIVINRETRNSMKRKLTRKSFASGSTSFASFSLGPSLKPKTKKRDNSEKMSSSGGSNSVKQNLDLSQENP